MKGDRATTMDDRNYAIAAAKSVITSSGRSCMTLKEFAADYLASESEEVPFRKFGYLDLPSYLVNEVGMKVFGMMVSFESEDTAHISEFIKGQKTKPKSLTSSRGPTRNGMPPPLPRPVTAVQKPISYMSNVALKAREGLEVYCKRTYSGPFRHELRLKLKACPSGVTPEEFVEFFNRSNFEKYKSAKDLDLKGLELMEFFHGLTDVFRVETENGVTRLYPTLTESPSLHKLGTPSMSAASFRVRSNVESLPSTNVPSMKRLPTVNEMSKLFNKVNEFYAGGQVGMTEYLAKVGELGGPDATSWLNAKAFNMETFSSFVAETALGFTIEPVRSRDAISICRPSPRPEPQPVHQASSLNDRTKKILTYEPYTTAIQTDRLVCDRRLVDLHINEFDATALNLYFTPVEIIPNRKSLMKRLLDSYSNTPDGQLSEAVLELGMPCVAPYETERVCFYRAVILSVDRGQAKVYYVDFGMKEVVPVAKLRRISPQFLNESAYAYPAVIVNAYPADGREKFAYKTLQDIKFELEFQVLKTTIARFNEDLHKYELDATVAMEQLQLKGLLSFERPTANLTPRGPPQPNGEPLTNGQANDEDLSDVSFQNQVLPNCEFIILVRRGSTLYIASSHVSRLLGLAGNTFLSSLEETRISVLGQWRPGSRLLEQLRAKDGNLMPNAEEVLIPVIAVAPLLRAYTFIHNMPLSNEKNILKLFIELSK